ncbi:histidine phosphatase family protein [Enterococcus gilvus]|uniref:histidine phosphatase family protein n=1 Tax=Enterococcus gilvus TaxID=160453 RepID=UPI003D6A1FF7
MSVKQAYLLKKKLAKLDSSIPVYTGSLKQTIETAELSFPNHPKFHLPELDEKDFGLWEGLRADQINQRYPVVWQRWLAAFVSFRMLSER